MRSCARETRDLFLPVIVFHSLSMNEIRGIVELQFNKMREMVLKNGIDTRLTDKARDFIAERGYDPAFGARPIKRILQKMVANPLSKYFLEGSIAKGDIIDVDCKDDQIAFNKVEGEKIVKEETVEVV